MPSSSCFQKANFLERPEVYRFQWKVAEQQDRVARKSRGRRDVVSRATTLMTFTMLCFDALNKLFAPTHPHYLQIRRFRP